MNKRRRQQPEQSHQAAQRRTAQNNCCQSHRYTGQNQGPIQLAVLTVTLGGSDPLQQLPFGNPHAPQSGHDGGKTDPRLYRQQKQLNRCAYHSSCKPGDQNGMEPAASNSAPAKENVSTAEQQCGEYSQYCGNGSGGKHCAGAANSRQ